jgi:hypothetical protein
VLVTDLNALKILNIQVATAYRVGQIWRNFLDR